MRPALKALERIPSGAPRGPLLGTLTLPFEERCKRRLRAHLDDGREIAIAIPHGPALRDGDRLRTGDGSEVEIRSAGEDVSTARSSDALRLARAAYHLGNRHVALEIAPGLLRYAHDHVLDDMLRKLGLEVVSEHCAFEPEGGAYAEGHAH
jgi:urease accessory protein